MNAYDGPDGRVVLDVARHPKMFATDKLGPERGRADARALDRRPEAAGR